MFCNQDILLELMENTESIKLSLEKQKEDEGTMNRIAGVEKIILH